MDFCRRSLAGGNVWDSLADLLKIMKLRGVGADDVKEVREIVQHLLTNFVKPARSKRDSRQAKTHVDNLLPCRSPRVVDHVELFLNSSALPSECNGAPRCCHFIVVERHTSVPPTPNSSARCRVLSMTHRDAVMLELWEGTS